MTKENNKQGRLIDLYSEGSLSKEALSQKVEGNKIEIIKLESRKKEIEERLSLSKNRAMEIEKMKREVKAIQKEKVYQAIGRMNNRDLKGLIAHTIDGRLTVKVKGTTRGKRGKTIPIFEAKGDYNLATGWEYLKQWNESNHLIDLA